MNTPAASTPITEENARLLRTGLHVLEHFLIAEQDGHGGGHQAAFEEAVRLSDHLTHATGRPGPGGNAVLDALLAGAPACRHCHCTVIRTGERLTGLCRVCGRPTGRPDDRLALSCTRCGAMRRTSQDTCRGYCRRCQAVTDTAVDPLEHVLTALGVHQDAEEVAPWPN